MALKHWFLSDLRFRLKRILIFAQRTCVPNFVEIRDQKFCLNFPRVPPLVRRIFFCSDPNETWSAGSPGQEKVTRRRWAHISLKPGRNRYFSFQNIGSKVARFFGAHWTRPLRGLVQLRCAGPPCRAGAHLPASPALLGWFGAPFFWVLLVAALKISKCLGLRRYFSCW